MPRTSGKESAASLQLLRALDSRSADARIDALMELAEGDQAVSRVAARAALVDTSKLVRQTGVDILGRAGTKADIRGLKLATQDPAWEVRSSAVEALARVAGKSALSILLLALHSDRSWVVRRDAALGLALVGASETQFEIEAAARRERNPIALVGVTVALIALGATAYFESFWRLLSHRDALVRENVVNACMAVPAIVANGVLVNEIRSQLESDPSEAVRAATRELASQAQAEPTAA